MKSFVRPPERDTPSKEVEQLRERVTSLDANFTMAIAFHEVWRPTAYDTDLHERMGRSYAGQAFLIIRASLRREMLLSLMRIWDTAPGAHSLEKALAALRKPEIWSSLVEDRMKRLRLPEALTRVSDHLKEEWSVVAATHAKYSPGGTHRAAFARLRDLRHQTLAHTQTPPRQSPPPADPADSEVSEFYEDTGQIVRRLMTIVNAASVSYEEASEVYSHYAKRFWINARGEQTEGHPEYRSRRKP